MAGSWTVDSEFFGADKKGTQSILGAKTPKLVLRSRYHTEADTQPRWQDQLHWRSPKTFRLLKEEVYRSTKLQMSRQIVSQTALPSYVADTIDAEDLAREELRNHTVVHFKLAKETLSTRIIKAKSYGVNLN